jgi:hypothetical protein
MLKQWQMQASFVNDCVCIEWRLVLSDTIFALDQIPLGQWTQCGPAHNRREKEMMF